ncbi:reverse transcriptase domain-containing protein [Tanacetum coccineum]
MEVLTTKIDSQFKNIKGEMKETRDGCNYCGGTHSSSECDDKTMGGPGEGVANYVQGGYRENYYGRNSGNGATTNKETTAVTHNLIMTTVQLNKHLRRNPMNLLLKNHARVHGRSKIVKFVKNQFFNFKTKVKQGQKNYQAAIYDLETKFGRSDQQSARPTGTLIPVEPADQEKTTCSCPYGTYAYKCMPFSLCNAPTTFQRCMITIFQDMLETSMEVFMDDFSVFRSSFNSCLLNHEQMLIRCKQANLVLNYEKCHFMVTEGIVLDQKLSSAGLEVDKAKIKIIYRAKNPNLEGLRDDDIDKTGKGLVKRNILYIMEESSDEVPLDEV